MHRQQNFHDKCKDTLNQMKTQRQSKMQAVGKQTLEKHLQRKTSVLETQKGMKISVLSFHAKQHELERSRRKGAIEGGQKFANRMIESSKARR